MRFTIFLVFIGVSISLVLPSLVQSTNTVQEERNNTANNYAITHEEIIRLTDGFMETLVQDVDQNYRVKVYHDKAAIMRVFEKFITKDAVKEYVDYYFTEENGALYLRPTETPPWFNKQNAYDVVQLNQDKFLVKQDNQSELFGTYRIELEFTDTNQGWRITNITHH